MAKSTRDQIRERRVLNGGGSDKTDEVAEAAAAIAKKFGLVGVPDTELAPTPAQEAEEEARQAQMQQGAPPQLVDPRGRPASPKAPGNRLEQLRQRQEELRRQVEQEVSAQSQQQGMKPSQLAGLALNAYKMFVSEGVKPEQAVGLTKAYALLEIGWQLAAIAGK